MNTVEAADKKFKTFVGVRATSDWKNIDQEWIQLYAGLMGDDQPIHVDETYAKATPYGGIIAHGFLLPFKDGILPPKYHNDRNNFADPGAIEWAAEEIARMERLGAVVSLEERHHRPLDAQPAPLPPP